MDVRTFARPQLGTLAAAQGTTTLHTLHAHDYSRLPLPHHQRSSTASTSTSFGRTADKLGPVLGVLEEELWGLEVRPVLLLQRPQLLHDDVGAEAVSVHKGPAAERREADAHDGRHVAVSRVADHARLKAVDGLDDEPEHHARVLVDGLLLGLRVRIVEEALARLAAEQARLDELVEHAQVGALHPDAQVSLLGVADEVVHHVARDVDANLVAEGDAADGHAKVEQRLIDLERVGPLLLQRHRLDQKRAEAPVDVEAGHVLDRDHRLALLDANLYGGRGHVRRRLVVGDHFEQRHLGHRREIVHPDDVLRPLCDGGDLADGQRRGV
eukprot:scaffold29229_cov101-Isochrysis_galbana.AAC.1